MPLKNFIKENFVLATGLALPVVLVILFFVASALPKAVSAPPQYELLFAETVYDSQAQTPHNVEFLVQEGALKARVWKLNGTASAPRKKLMVFDAKNNSLKELSYNLSKVRDAVDQTEITLDEFKTMKVESSNKAPDGYEFENPGYGSGGLVTDLFGGGYRNRMPRIVKGGAVFNIPNKDTRYYGGNIQFVGWIIQK